MNNNLSFFPVFIAKTFRDNFFPFWNTFSLVWIFFNFETTAVAESAVSNRNDVTSPVSCFSNRYSRNYPRWNWTNKYHFNRDSYGIRASVPVIRARYFYKKWWFDIFQECIWLQKLNTDDSDFWCTCTTTFKFHHKKMDKFSYRNVDFLMDSIHSVWFVYLGHLSHNTYIKLNWMNKIPFFDFDPWWIIFVLLLNNLLMLITWPYNNTRYNDAPNTKHYGKE